MFCSFSWAADLKIRSNIEETAIFISPNAKIKANQIGLTPKQGTKDEDNFFKQSLDSLSSYTVNKSFILELRKDGFEPYRILIPYVKGNDIVIDVNLTRSSNLEMLKEIDAITNKLFNAQRLIRAKNYDDAITFLTKIDGEYPGLSVVKELIGASWYMKKDYKRSYGFYRQAFYANAENKDAQKMLLYLEKSMGIKPLRGEKQ